MQKKNSHWRDMALKTLIAAAYLFLGVAYTILLIREALDRESES